MAELKMTPRRLSMLRAIGDGAVTQHYSILPDGIYSRVDCDGAGWVRRTARYVTVTGRVEELRNAGLCKPGVWVDSGWYRSPRVWELTDAGRAVLDVHGTAP